MGELKVEERDILISRLKDLAGRRDSGNYCTFSPFLSPDIVTDVRHIKNVVFCGGYPDAERVVAAFLPDYMSEQDVDWPISFLIITPSDGKTYNHRDYLGSLMSLGIKRQVMGDIIIDGGKAYLFCQDSIEEFIINNLTHVAGTSVNVRRADSSDDLPQRKFEKITGTVASERLDTVVALAANTSRSRAAEFITAGNVMVNGREMLKTTFVPKTGDIFSVRGKGKFVYGGALGVSRKGRTVIEIKKYI